MRLWNGIRSLGAYLLPDQTGLRGQLERLAEDSSSEDGKAWILSVQTNDARIAMMPMTAAPA
jgi:hypothetical protein